MKEDLTRWSRRTFAAAWMNTVVALMNATAPEKQNFPEREKAPHLGVSSGGELESEVHFSKTSPYSPDRSNPNSPRQKKKLNLASHLSLAEITTLLANASQLKFPFKFDFEDALTLRSDEEKLGLANEATNCFLMGRELLNAADRWNWDMNESKPELDFDWIQISHSMMD